MALIMGHINERVENILGKVENAGNQYFLLLPQYFQKKQFSFKIFKNFLTIIFLVLLRVTFRPDIRVSGEKRANEMGLR